MIFSSIEFLLFFLPLFLITYAIVPAKLKNVTLLSGSLVFYALGDSRYLVLLMLSVIVNYFFGLHLGRGARQRGRDKGYQRSRLDRKRRTLLFLAVGLNIGLLVWFKYSVDTEDFPLGLSFYTFQILSYLIDVYRGEQPKETSFVSLATYIVMFPQLISGPIVSYGEVREALGRRPFTLGGIQEGLKVFTMGLAAKVLLADRVGLLFRELQVTGFESISTPLAWLGAVAYSMRLYFDFYGYSLMAVGLGRMLGFELPANFRNPYMAVSVRDFYRRWHMTLGRWFCKYVYIPLGGNRKGELRTMGNLILVWILTSLWHGSSLNFLLWGMFLVLLIIIERLLSGIKVPGRLKGPLRIVSHLYVWTVIPVSWMCFAITDISQLQVFLGRMFGFLPGINVNQADFTKALSNYGALLLAGAFACTPGMQKLFKRLKDTLPGVLFLVALFWICVWRLQVEGQNPFMYSKF